MFVPTEKQKAALDLLTDYETEFVGYGGAAGGGKSYLGCYWLMQLGYYAPNTKYFIGRDSLKDTRESVLQSWRKLAIELEFQEWKYSDNKIQFDNGSLIDFLDLSFYPQKDPMFERFGSKEYTCGWIEEASQCHPLAFEILKTRIGRYLNYETKIKKKILCTFNPRKNWIDTTFYRPYKEGKEKKDTRFIYALATDNPHLPDDYIETLRNLKDKATKERLLNGNFDYDDDPDILIPYDKILDMFSNLQVQNMLAQKYITCDVARMGSDLAVILVWRGWEVIAIQTFDVSKTTDIQRAITALKIQYGVPNSNIIADEDGVGGGVVDNLNIKGFVNGSKPLRNPKSKKEENYLNLKTQCAYKFADRANEGGVYVSCDLSNAQKDAIKQEMGQLKTYNADHDGKLCILPKEQIKENIGRSPDYLDSLVMRVWFDLKSSTPGIIWQ